MAISIDGVVTSYTNTNLMYLPVNVDLARLSIGTLNNRLDRTIHLSFGEFYLSTSYHDLSIPSQLAKFWTSTGPVDLGLLGELPSGSPPYIYLSGDVLHNFGSGPEISEVKASGASSYSTTTLGPWPNITTGLVKQRNSYWRLLNASGTLDASEHTICFWVRLLETPSVWGRVFIWEGGTAHFNLLISPYATANMTLQDSAGSSQGLGTALSNLGWHHIAIARRYSTNTLKVSIDGVGSSYTIATSPTLPFNVDTTKFNVGATNGANRGFYCAVGEMWFAPRYLDVTDPNVISKFYSASKPVPLGNNGSLVDGKQPYIYISGSSFYNFGTSFQLQEMKDAGALSIAPTPLPN